MKKNILLTATLAFLGLATTPLFAQTSPSTTTTSNSYIPSSSVIGSKIKDSRGQDVGEIKDIVLDRSSGCLAYVVLSTRGTGTTTTAKTVAAPWSVFSASSEPRVFMTRIEREKLYSAPVWESTRIEEYSRPEYINSVYGYYGVTPSFSVGVTATTGTTNTTTTGVTASTNASATPAATASVGATMTPAATATTAATMTPAASASATTKPSPSSSTKSSTKTKSPADDSATSPSPKKKTTSESAKTETAPADSTKSTTKKTETKTEKAPKSETSTETTADSSKSKSKKSEKKSTEPETAPTP